MITILALVLSVITSLMGAGKSEPIVVIPPMPQYLPDSSYLFTAEDREWMQYRSDAYWEYSDMFTALFDSYEIKRAKNGALMIRSGNSGSFKFCKKG